ncbi:E3 ubiquitin-protein ligase TRIM50 [Latimeria chalumnae]|uniref:RING-type E3 ubiquitin transferase n=1 Tax=Latimeria chalumnae TaxID=7897 RepID=H3BI13_LATCH|nr:PREDICTED: E3 ubiquitin-protein ligase TRIM50 [Latimeria chalumnae]|eukprot:XP_005986962.1 PREDICTED: E3 ubiquitin-protein ligase TRIM50 [Latimeria chalumnae]
MARRMSLPELEDQLLCPICLEVFKEPLMLQCGHSYCKSCLTSLSGELEGQVLCPVCRKEVDFNTSPPNVSLARIIEALQTLGDADTDQESCPEHNNPLSLYCEKDQEVICGLCGIIGTHRQHQITPISSVFSKMKEELSLLITDVQLQKSNLEKYISKLINNKSRISNESDVLKWVIRKEFGELRRYIDEEEDRFMREMELKTSKLISSINLQVKEMSETLKKFEDIESTLDILNNEDCLNFIRKYGSIASRTKMSEQPQMGSAFSAISFKPGFRHDDIKITVWKRLHKRILPDPELLKFDPLTAHPLLNISRDDTMVACGLLYKRLPNNPERFDYNNCVLVTKGFSSGKHYWEVVVGCKVKWRLGIIKGSTSRKGKLNKSPENGVWLIGRREGPVYEAFTSPRITLPLSTRPQKVAVFLDYEKGELSFYNADKPDELVPFYTFNEEFQGKLYPFFDTCWHDRGNNPLPIILPQPPTA